MTDQPNDALAQRAAEVDEAGRKKYGDRVWNGISAGLGKKMNDGRLTQIQLAEIINGPDPVQRVAYEGLPEADDETWGQYRDVQPHRARRIEALSRERDR